MSTTIVKTKSIPMVADRSGASAEILNQKLCGAVYSHGVLRSLEGDAAFDAASAKPRHQLIYVLEGRGVVRIDAAEYEVEKGGGVYLAPSEAASIRQAGSGPLKLFHLTVPAGAA